MRPILRTSCSLLLGLLGLTGNVLAAVSSNIIVDQFGYRTAAAKIVVFAQPNVGVGSPSVFTPGASFEVRRVSDNAVVFTGSPAQWNGGATHSQSGDKAWQGTFTALNTPGSYYVSVPGGSNPGSQSYPFQISDSVFNGVVTASQRAFFFQRCGLAISGGNGGSWTHTVCHEGGSQDLASHLWNGSDQGQARDVHGGWHDAGDYNKYVTFAHASIWYLLHAWEWYPLGYTDATNIPESGNGVPDLLDEVKWELDWMLRMQRSSDGALYSVVGQTSGSTNPGNPANDTTARYYTNVSTTATATGAMAFALGARILGAFPAYAAYAVTLQNAAVSAWGYLSTNTSFVSYNNSGISNANANMDATWDAQARCGAAAELYALTGVGTYQAYFDSNYNSAAVAGPVSNPPNVNDMADPSGAEPLVLGMVSYCLAPGATASVVSAIRNALKNEIEWNIMPNNPGSDPYMGYMYDGHYCWGSNQLKAAWGNQLLFAVKIGANPSQNTAYTTQAEEYLHYFHGRNPLNWVYLTNMGTGGANLGASKSVRSIFHSWFWAGTTYDGNTGGGALGPAPGILPGGPNQFYPSGAYTGTYYSPPQDQPPMKSYKDWGNGWPDNSWEVTEPDQGYQAKYQFLLSAFAGSTQPTATPTPTSTGTPATPTRTPTTTASPSATPSATPTATTCTVLLNGAETLGENGTWSGANATRTIVGSATAPLGSITQGVSLLRVNVTTASGWNDQVFNLDGFAPTDWSQVVQLKLDLYVESTLRTGATYSQLFLRADSNPVTWYQPISNDTPSLSTGQNIDVTFNINWSAGVLTPGMPITKLTFVYNSDSSDGTGSFYVDNIRLVTNCVPTPTRTPSRTPTFTSSPTSSPTPSLTFTPSSTQTASLTPSPSATSSSTPTPTATPSPTNVWTPTSSPTLTPSPTGTLVPVLTATPTATSSATPTATLTASSTPTTTPTSTRTNTSSPTPFPATSTATTPSSPTPTLTPTPTRSPTVPAPTLTPSSTSTLSPTLTRTRTGSPTPSATLTPTPTATSTLSSSPTLVASFTPGSTPVLLANPVRTGTLQVLPQAYGGTSTVTVQLYTTSFKLVLTKKFPSVPSGIPLDLELLDDWGEPLGNGVYYVFVSTKKDRKSTVLVVLR